MPISYRTKFRSFSLLSESQRCQECWKVWQIFRTGVVIPERSTHIGMYAQSLCYYIGHLCWNGVDGCGSAQYSHGLLNGSLIIWTARIARKTFRALTEANSVKTIPARHYFVLADPFSGPDKVILFFFQFSLWPTPSGIFQHPRGRHPCRHNWNIAFFFVWSSSLPFWKDLDFWVAHQSKLL